MRRPALTEQMVIAALEEEFGDNVEYRRPEWGSGLHAELTCCVLRAQIGESTAAMVPARTDTEWWHQLCAPWEIRFLKGRVRFDDHATGAPFPSAIVLFGDAAWVDTVMYWDPRSGDRSVMGAGRLTVG